MYNTVLLLWSISFALKVAQASVSWRNESHYAALHGVPDFQVRHTMNLTCTSQVCPPDQSCVFVPALNDTACCSPEIARTCVAGLDGSCNSGLELCPGSPFFCCTPGSVCVQTTISGDTEVICDVNSTSPIPSAGMTATGMSEGASSSSTISAPSSTTSQALPPTPTSPTSLRPGTNYTLSPDDPSITYSPFNSSWTPAPQENLPICAKNTSTRSTTQQNAKISFNTTGTRVFVRTVNSPQGGSYTITFGNKTQNFTSHSDTPSCDSSPGLQTLLQNTHVLAISGGDLQQVVITNGESAFTFIDIIVSQDAEGPMISSQNTADSVPRSTLFNVLSLLFLECLSLALI